MSHCSRATLVQDFLDGQLPPDEAAAFRAHLVGCAECAGEAASFERLFATLDRPLPVWLPDDLSVRILDRVLPSRVRRRRLVALGWGYAAALAACGGVLALWWLTPGRQAFLGTLSAQASRRLLGAGLFVLDTLGASAVHLADGWGWLHAAAARLAPLTRALAAVFSQPDIGLAVWAATAVCAALLWWMRPRPSPAVRRVHHVGFLGY
jgi:anti-sigma factor RsiW